MIIILLLLIVLILLFGAGIVKGWLKNALGAVLGIGLFAGLMITIVAVFGEDAFWWVWGGGAALFILIGLLVQQYDPEKAWRDRDLKARIKRAQKQREERRKKGLKW